MVRSYKWIEVAQYITGTDESFLTGATPKASHLASTANSGCGTFRWRISASADSKATLSPIKPDLLILRDLLANFVQVLIPRALEMFTRPHSVGSKFVFGGNRLRAAALRLAGNRFPQLLIPKVL
jgi:hypothetical protein